MRGIPKVESNGEHSVNGKTVFVASRHANVHELLNLAGYPVDIKGNLYRVEKVFSIKGREDRFGDVVGLEVENV